MGIGRREFLKLFGAGMATLSADPASAISVLDDQYVNWKLGIAFRKPKGWTFADVKEVGAEPNVQIFRAGLSVEAPYRVEQMSDSDDSDLTPELIESAALPILTISRDRPSASAGKFTPRVTIHMDRFLCGYLETIPDVSEVEMPPLENLTANNKSGARMLKDFRVTSPPTSVRVSECDAAESTVEYLLEHENIRQPTRVRVRALAIFQRPAFYTIRMHDSPYDPDTTFDYTPFVESIKIV